MKYNAEDEENRDMERLTHEEWDREDEHKDDEDFRCAKTSEHS